jgi:tRNA dimethylallyltransferase
MTAAASQRLPSPLMLAGPTGAGKSEIALLLAERLGAEIVSVDSMQVYRGMDIGTAKPSPEERARVPHHLLDVADVTEAFDAARFVELARKAVADIEARGRVALLCGGTGLYFKAFLEGLQNLPSDPALRAQLEATPLPELLTELQQRDPAAYERVDRNNLRRVVRAIEVIRLTGKPFSSQRADWAGAVVSTSKPPALFCLSRASADLHERIARRTEEMFRCGLVVETEELLGRGLAGNRNAMQAIGYRQVVEHLQGGPSLPETVELVKARTRQFARRQMVWFRRQLPVAWIHVEASEASQAVVERLLASLPAA